VCAETFVWTFATTRGPYVEPWPKACQTMMAKVFEDRVTSGDWRVEYEDEDGEMEIAIFGGPNAYERAIVYADKQYGDFEEIRLAPY
jgi:hypothetical protein